MIVLSHIVMCHRCHATDLHGNHNDERDGRSRYHAGEHPPMDRLAAARETERAEGRVKAIESIQIQQR